MREIRPSGSEGGVAHPRHPYPYFSFALRAEDPSCECQRTRSIRQVIGHRDVSSHDRVQGVRKSGTRPESVLVQNQQCDLFPNPYKGFRPPDQGCEERATLGNPSASASTPKELCFLKIHLIIRK